MFKWLLPACALGLIASACGFDRSPLLGAAGDVPEVSMGEATRPGQTVPGEQAGDTPGPMQTDLDDAPSGAGPSGTDTDEPDAMAEGQPVDEGAAGSPAPEPAPEQGPEIDNAPPDLETPAEPADRQDRFRTSCTGDAECYADELCVQGAVSSYCAQLCGEDSDCEAGPPGTPRPQCAQPIFGTRACRLPCDFAVAASCPNGMVCQAIPILPNGSGSCGFSGG